MSGYDSLVLGGGPAGLSAALYLARFGLTVGLVEQLTSGGLLLATDVVENYPGFPQGIKGYKLADAFAAHVANYTIDQLSGKAVELDLSTENKRVRLEDGQWVTAQSIIVCSGGSHRKLGLPNEEALTGRGVSYCALCDAHFFRGQAVAVVGGGNSALEEALFLSTIASEVHLIHRRDTFRGDSVLQQRVTQKNNIHIWYNSVVSALLEDDKGLTGLVMQDVLTNATRQLSINGLFVFIGFVPASAFLPDSIERDNQGFIVTDSEMNTTVPGIFAAGDIRAKLCRQIATAVGDGVTAANSAYLYLGK